MSGESADVAKSDRDARLCIALHDVAPATWPQCVRLLDLVDALGAPPVTLLVVPDWHAQGRIDAAAEFCRAIDSAAPFREPITELVNGTFGVLAASSPCFRQGAASFPRPRREFRGLVRRYGALLLTMIKKVLIAAISFASLCQ